MDNFSSQEILPETAMIIAHLEQLKRSKHILRATSAANIIARPGGRPTMTVKALRELESLGFGRYEIKRHGQSRFVFTKTMKAA